MNKNMAKRSNNEINNSESFKDDEIDIGLLFNFVLRNKILIGSLSFIFFVIACIYSLTLKRIWSGEFQIVLNSDQKSSEIFENFSPIVDNLVDVDKDLSTQVGILESPSVLMPIFDYYNSTYKSETKTDNVVPSFSSWKGNLKIKLEKGTKILKISYKDTNKEAILNVLNKISNVYQDYSGRDKRRTQELTVKYLKEQVNFYRQKSLNSLKKSQSYAIDQDLTYINFGGVNSINPLEIDSSSNPLSKLSEQIQKQPTRNSVVSNVEIENIRAGSANEIRLIDLQIKKIQELGNDIDRLQFIGSTILPLVAEGLPQSLADIEQILVEKETLFTKDDPSVIVIREQRDRLINLLKKRSIGYLKAQRLEAEARMQAAIRPKGVLLKYKELIREAERDEGTLIALENKLRTSEVEQAKLNDPWKLITNPTLLKRPVGPKRKNIGITGLILGFLIGSIFSFFKEKKSGKVFNPDIIKQLLSSPLIEKIDIKNKISKREDILFLKDFIKNQPGNKVSFIALENIEKNYPNRLKDFLMEECDLKKEINVFNSLTNYSGCVGAEIVILLISLNNAKYSDIEILKNRLNLLNVDLTGFLLLEN